MSAEIPVRRRSRHWALRFLIVFVLLGLIAAVAGRLAWDWAQGSVDRPTVTTEQVFEVPDGAGVNRVADLLEGKGLVDRADVVKLVLRVRGEQPNIVPGEFQLTPGMSVADIYAMIDRGDIIQYRFTAPEGTTVAQILSAMDAHPVLVDDNPEPPPEGTLLPETYLFPRGTKQSEVVQQMRDAHDRTVAELWAARKPGLPITSPAEAVNLASIVEKETGVGAERAEVAGVFTNRLRRGMMLQSDPTIIYGISKGIPLGRGLRRSEIDRETPWNTYKIPRLPKTPIANPGREALAAVMNPAETDALYFVADGTGGHVFARTYAEHKRNVDKWRVIERQNRARERQQESQQ